MPKNTKLSATVSGKVVYAGMGKSGTGYGNYGNVVAIKDSNGYVHVFAHMNSVSVKVGQSVSKGGFIGYSGNTGNSTGAHLHYEVRKNGQLHNTINPLQFL